MAFALLFVFSAGGLLLADDGDPVFRSDVSLVRVDARVVDRDNRAVPGLRVEDFVLLEEGRPQKISNFAREDMAMDVLLLFDVSASMRPHIQRIANAAHQALLVLGKDDRVAIMVFDRTTRVRLPFRSSREDVMREFDSLLRQETFRGGTDITVGMLDAARYIERNGRRDARRAIVIVTDDQTEMERDEARVSRALMNADAVLSAIIAPDAMGNMAPGVGRGGSYPGGGYPGGRYPGGGGRRGGGLGGVIIGGGGWGIPGTGGGGSRGGGRVPGTTMGGPHTHSAGTDIIARESGGDSMPIDDAAVLETTFSRLRQRYALHFHAPQNARAGQQRTIDVELSEAARRRYPDAEVRYRRLYVAPGGSGTQAASTNAEPEPVVVSRQPAGITDRGADPPAVYQAPVPRRGTAISEPDGSHGPNPSVGTPQPKPQPE